MLTARVVGIGGFAVGMGMWMKILERHARQVILRGLGMNIY